jgi:hypothetical protein
MSDRQETPSGHTVWRQMMEITAQIIQERQLSSEFVARKMTCFIVKSVPYFSPAKVLKSKADES